MQSVIENQQIISESNKWKEFYHKHKVTVTIWLLFFLSVAIRSLLASGMKLLTTYEDELLYYGLAENLARNHSFSIYYLPYVRLDRIIYSIIIAPAFLVQTRELQFLIIAIINALLLTSGIFPSYLLAKDILESDVWALFVGTLYVFMPDMAYTGTFMTDLCFLPIALWVFYFAYRINGWRELSYSERWKYGLLFLFVSIIACFTKQAGILFLPAFFASFIICNLNKIDDIRESMKRWQRTLIIIIIILCVLVLAVITKYLHIPVLYRLERIVSIVFERPLSYLSYNGYSISQMVIAGLIFPIILPFIYVKQYDEKSRRFLNYLLFVTVLVLLAESYTQASGLYSIRRIHLRYVLFLWMPYIILFIKLFKQGNITFDRRAKVGWGLLLAWTASLFYWNRGTEWGSVVDYTMLYFTEKWDRHWSIYSFVTGLFVLLIFFLILRKQWKKTLICFFIIWFAVQGYNNVLATNVISKSYKADNSGLKEISVVEDFIVSHKDDKFLLLTFSDEPQVPIRRWSDTYLNYPNVRTAFYKQYIGNENSDGSGYNLQDNPLRSYFGNYFDDTEFDYIIVPCNADSCIDTDKVRLVASAENNLFDIYELNNSTDMPAIFSFQYLRWGDNYFKVNNKLFASQYETDGLAYFCSQGSEPGYVLYGPYRTLPPGEYQVVVYFEDETGTEGTQIGRVDLNSASSLAAEVEPISIWSGDNMAIFSFSTKEEIEMFETRIWAEVPGVRAKAIDIIYTPLEEN